MQPLTLATRALESTALARLFDVLDDGVMVLDDVGAPIRMNKAAEQLLGREAVARVLAGEARPGSLGLPDLPAVLAAVRQAGSWAGNGTVRSAEGKALPVRIVVNGLRDRDGAIKGAIGTIRDLTAQALAESDLSARTEQQRAVAELSRKALSAGVDDLAAAICEASERVLGATSTAYFRLEQDGLLLLTVGNGWSPGMVGNLRLPGTPTALLGYVLDRGTPLVLGDHLDPGMPAVDVFLPAGARGAVLVPVQGEDRAYGVLGIYFEEPGVAGDAHLAFAQTVADILGSGSDRRRSAETLSRLTLLDVETGLENYDSLLFRARELLRTAKAPLSVVMVRLDGYDDVMTAYGREPAQRLLIASAFALQHRLGSRPARIGPNELSVLVEDRRPEAVGEDAKAALAAPVPVRAGVHAYPFGAIGVAQGQPGDHAATVLGNARAAMVTASRTITKAGVLPFTGRIKERAATALRLASAVEAAVNGGHLTIAVQPGLSLSARAPSWGEVLTRFTDRALAEEPVSELIKLAERTGTIHRLGVSVLARAAAALGHWRVEGYAPDLLSVNLSAVQLDRWDLADQLSQALLPTGLAPSNFCLELTETAVASNPVAAQRAMSELAERGFRLLIDDFGSGQTSLAWLLSFPFAGVKIDRSLLLGATEESHRRAVLRSIVDLVAELDGWSVVEGVETAQQAELVAELGVDIGQGYFYARPQPPKQAGSTFRTLTSQRRSRPAPVPSRPAPPLHGRSPS